MHFWNMDGCGPYLWSHSQSTASPVVFLELGYCQRRRTYCEASRDSFQLRDSLTPAARLASAPQVYPPTPTCFGTKVSEVGGA